MLVRAKISSNSAFLGLRLAKNSIFLLINIKMPTIAEEFVITSLLGSTGDFSRKLHRCLLRDSPKTAMGSVWPHL